MYEELMFLWRRPNERVLVRRKEKKMGETPQKMLPVPTKDVFANKRSLAT